jgi:2-amino-4-hydroxy-6-hydroxymethyldihydropteridine diphosphokinase
MPPSVIFLSLGSNLGNRLGWLQTGVEALKQVPKTTLIAVSNLYETGFVGESSHPQADYLNMACQLETYLSPEALLGQLLAIEEACGRKRSAGQKNEPRTLDVDLIAYDALVLRTPTLTLPHPRLQERLFVLMPLLDLPATSTWVHPVLGQSIQQLKEALPLDDSQQSIALYSFKN